MIFLTWKDLKNWTVSKETDGTNDIILMEGEKYPDNIDV